MVLYAAYFEQQANEITGESKSKPFKAHKLIREVAAGSFEEFKDYNADQQKGNATNVLLRLVKRGLILKEKGNGNRYVYKPNPKLVPVNLKSVTEETAPVLLEEYEGQIGEDHLAKLEEAADGDEFKKAVLVAGAINGRVGLTFAEDLRQGNKVNVEVSLEEIREKEDVFTPKKAKKKAKKKVKRKSPKKKKAPKKHAKKKSSASGLDDFW